MATRWSLPGDDRGAVLIHVALGVLALTAFLTIVADFGLMWTARRQAQNSADAGAIAGATGLGYDDPSDYSQQRRRETKCVSGDADERLSGVRRPTWIFPPTSRSRSRRFRIAILTETV